jgi:hypothetical protein
MIAKRLLEGPGAGVTFELSELDIITNDQGQNQIWGSLTMRSAYDISVVKAEQSPMGTLSYDMDAVEGLLQEELFRMIDSGETGAGDEIDTSTIRVDLNERLMNETVSVGRQRARFSGVLEIEGVEILAYCRTANGAEIEVEGTAAAFLEFIETVSLAYDDLDDPDRFTYENEDGEIVQLENVYESDYTYFT